MFHNLSLIIRREYLERVYTKSFIITTLLMPLLMLGCMAAPTLIMLFSGPEERTIAVVDASGIVAPALEDNNDITFKAMPADISLDSLRNSGDYEAILVVGEDIVTDNSNVQLYTDGAPSMLTEEYITNSLEDIIERQRIASSGIPDLAQIMDQVKADVKITTYRIDSGEDKETSSIASFLVGLVMAFMLYMFLLIYGQMIMSSIIEEKNNRVLEVIVSSVKPTTLMLGKIIGVGLVAATQVLIWGILLATFSRFVMPILTAGMSPDADADLMAAMGQLGDPGFMVMIFVYILLFLIGGYMIYAAIFAAIGAAVDNVQDASQLTSIPMVPIIVGLICSMSVGNDPNGPMAFWTSMIPFTSPMAMMARIPFGIPGWEIALSLVLLIVTALLLVWLAAKIYRVGIFMYGKKPSIAEIIRWARYK